ncbi:MAG: hypothetical protein ABR606_02285 [Vicinamibacterales bacterium]
MTATVGTELQDGVNVYVVRGAAAGSTTITARSAAALEATVEISVVTNGALPQGTVRWATPPLAAGGPPALVRAHPDLSGDETFAAVGWDDDGFKVRAISGDGQQKWLASISEESYVARAIADGFGGVLLQFGNTGFLSGDVLLQIGGMLVSSNWRYQAPQYAAIHGLAVASDGFVYAVEHINGQKYGAVVGIEGDTGRVRFRVPLPSSHAQGSGCAPESNYSIDYVANPTNVRIGTDGYAYTLVNSSTTSYTRGTCPGADPSVVHDARLELLKVSPTGAATRTTLWSSWFSGPVYPDLRAWSRRGSRRYPRRRYWRRTTSAARRPAGLPVWRLAKA